MSGHRYALVVGLTVLAAAIAHVRPASAQCRLCETPSVASQESSDEESLDISVDTDLDFDRLLLASTGEGSARLTPDGTRLASGSIASIGGRAVVARIVVSGRPGRKVSIDLPKRVELRGIKGGSLVVESVISDLPSDPALDSNGKLEFRIGGELVLTGDADGEYRGDVPVSVDYL
ncbi:DUF4402 domain-containing protein [Sphingomonas sp. HDW15A]|uniref:DUF4402 domain-containing protein n=1 Tax=Sphingomonas sp. HDW15A TaxID=2714942 RepID=UPI00140C97C7|nr:DUF4402 domain-containing protein [Sphingomonas sp. HDW15A]QIK96980.1 DUF4402 domain-containing protein [Sphingomonas sp. HDW15A]